MATLKGPFVVLEITTVSGGGGGGGPPPVVMLPPPHATAKAKVADTTAPRRIFMPRDSTPTIVAVCCPCALCDPVVKPYLRSPTIILPKISFTIFAATVTVT